MRILKKNLFISLLFTLYGIISVACTSSSKPEILVTKDTTPAFNTSFTSSITPTPLPSPSASFSQNRVALIIGNSTYAQDNYLSNSTNDAKALAQILRQLHFQVIYKTNLNYQEMKEVIRQFTYQLFQNPGVGLFYFSGYGIQYQEKNYLIPIGAEYSLKAVYDLPHETVTVDDVFNTMKMVDNPINIFILDACRPLPDFVERWDKPQMIPSGLTWQANIPSNSLIAYAATPGKVALSGEENKYSPYIASLLKWIPMPNLSISEVFRRVQQEVSQETRQKQQPPYIDNLKEPFYLNWNVTMAEAYQVEQERLIRERKVREQEQARTQATQKCLVQQRESESSQTRVSSSTRDTFVPGKVFQDRLLDGSLGPKMVWIPAGTFQMGDIQGDGDDDEKPVHLVSIKCFAMGRYEVTFAEYDKFAKVTGRIKPDDLFGKQRHNRPVVNISWKNANAYAQWLSQQTGKVYRLPTEAEWEYAARAGTKTKYWWGNQIILRKANCDNRYCGDHFEYMAPVGSFVPNPFGLYDTVGNVWEWTCSEYEERYNGKEQQCIEQNSVVPRVIRGGAWFGAPRDVRVTVRHQYSHTSRFFDVGFRLVRLPL